MKKNVILITVSITFLISFCTIYKIYAKTITISHLKAMTTVNQSTDSKILAKVGSYEITQNDLNEKRKDTQFSDQNGKTFTDKEVLDVMVKDKLLLTEAKQLNINFSDEEVRGMEKQMEAQMSWTGYQTGKFKGLTNNQFQRFKEDLEINEVKQRLGANIDNVLDQLKNSITIIYYQ